LKRGPLASWLAGRRGRYGGVCPWICVHFKGAIARYGAQTRQRELRFNQRVADYARTGRKHVDISGTRS
jgi:hypothetical protein